MHAKQSENPAKCSFFQTVALSLGDIVGNDYLEAVCAARSWLTGESAVALRSLAQTPVDLLPQAFYYWQIGLLRQVGSQVCPGLGRSRQGATTRAFTAATKPGMAPLSASGLFRVGEDGRLYLITKSEHYHASLGHTFPGYRLLDVARNLGIPNATHNNTRGWITRQLEEELVAAAAGDQPGALNCVLNLETGSLAVEAAFKMIMARFYQPQSDSPDPCYKGRIPVLLVMGDDDGGSQGNYHGTTMLLQTARGMWSEMASALDAAGIFKVAAIRPNCLEDLEHAFAVYEQAPCKIAGFFHEIVMMNYGGRLLSREFLSRAYELCQAHDVPILVDEIQSCMWARQFFMFREYGLTPTFVALGKGFPGGEYSASRLLFDSSMDVLPQFGALVTNGQEELASLAYLVTMRWAKANARVTSWIGCYYEERVRELAERHRDLIAYVDGWHHMTTLAFQELPPARAFTARLNQLGLDISVQTYKPDCPPVVLTKLPLIANSEVVDFVLDRFETALNEMKN